MSDYSPQFLPGKAITSVASATIVGGQTLVVSGNGTVGPAGAAAANFIGVAGNDAASGAEVLVFGRGTVHVSTASGGITAGARVDTGAAGTVATAASALTNIGVALTTAADTASVTWMEI
jgi:hypothetical protein